MPIPRHLSQLAIVGTLLCLAASAGMTQGLLDVVVFDEDDATGTGYYDASVPGITAPSALTTVASPYGGKLPVLTGRATSGSQFGLLEWRSAAGGNWSCFIASPGFQPRDLTGRSNLVFFLNGPQAIPAASLPRLGLESSSNQRTALAEIASWLPGGLDGDTNTWQRVDLPLTAFLPFGGFLPSQFKAVYFAQGLADNVQRTLWLDNVRFSDGWVPPAPTGLVSRSGDRTVVLHWTRDAAPATAGYLVDRAATTNGPFALLTGQPVVAPSYVDFSVTNGQSYAYRLRAITGSRAESDPSAPMTATPVAFADDTAFLDYLQRITFDFFWYEANPTNGLVRDRSRADSVVSVAGVGFGLSGINLAVDRGWITREQARQRVLTTLRTLYYGAQGTNSSGVIGCRGWFYHLLGLNTATRDGQSELSSIDTALLLAGVLDARQFFDAQQASENEIRWLASAIFNRVDWHWMVNGGNSLSMGWQPESGFLPWRWTGYNEAMLLYLLGLGVQSNPLPPSFWQSWISGYGWRTNYGQSYVEFPPLFGHQYSHCWVDFRHITDAWMGSRGTTYFENSRRATLAQRAYCMANPGAWAGYGSNTWGLTACDGPGFGSFAGYAARGAPPALNDDGTLAPTAVGGSLPFAPEVCLPALRSLYSQYRTNLWMEYGFRDAFNLAANWWDPDVLSIDQGAILLMAENYRSQSVWRRFMRCPEIQRGLATAGFTNLLTAAPQLQRGAAAGSWCLNWASQTGHGYQVEYSPDLRGWFVSPTGFITATGAESTWLDDGPPATTPGPVAAPERYYRVFRLGRR